MSGRCWGRGTLRVADAPLAGGIDSSRRADRGGAPLPGAADQVPGEHLDAGRASVIKRSAEAEGAVALPSPPKPQARIDAGLLQVCRQLLDKPHRHPLLPCRLLEQDESRPGFAVEVLGLEDGL